MSDAPDFDAIALPSGRFEGRVEFQQVIRDALPCAAQQGWREVVLSDPDFADWPLGERAVAEALNAWSRNGRKMILLARRYDEVVRRHARFVTWRQTWSHIIDARACPSADVSELPSAIWSSGWVMQRMSLDHCNGVSGTEPRRRLLLREDLNEWLGRSSPSFPATTLGL